VAFYGVLDIGPHAGLRPVYPCVPLAQDVRFKCHEFIRGVSPCDGIAFELLKKRRADVLAEKDPFFINVEIDGDRPCGMTGGVETVDGGRAKPQYLLIAGEFYIHKEWDEGDVEAEGGTHVLVPLLDNLSVEGMHYDVAAEMEPELCCTSHVIHVTMGEDDGGDTIRGKAERSNVPHDLRKTDACPAVHQDECTQVDEVDGSIPYVGQGGTTDLVNMLCDPYWLHLQLPGLLSPVRVLRPGTISGIPGEE